MLGQTGREPHVRSAQFQKGSPNTPRGTTTTSVEHDSAVVEEKKWPSPCRGGEKHSGIASTVAFIPTVNALQHI